MILWNYESLGGDWRQVRTMKNCMVGGIWSQHTILFIFNKLKMTKERVQSRKLTGTELTHSVWQKTVHSGLFDNVSVENIRKEGFLVSVPHHPTMCIHDFSLLSIFCINCIIFSSSMENKNNNWLKVLPFFSSSLLPNAVPPSCVCCIILTYRFRGYYIWKSSQRTSSVTPWFFQRCCVSGWQLQVQVWGRVACLVLA